MRPCLVLSVRKADRKAEGSAGGVGFGGRGAHGGAGTHLFDEAGDAGLVDLDGAFGFAAWLVRDKAQEGMSGLDRLVFRAYVGGGAGFVLIFLWSGASSIPRRWAVHYEEWQFQSQLASAFALIVVLATAGLVIRYALGLARRE